MKKNFSIGLVIVLLLCFSYYSAFADEYDEDDVLQPWKVAAYAVYPAGFVLKYLVVKPYHWFMHLPLFNNITGHKAITENPID